MNKRKFGKILLSTLSLAFAANIAKPENSSVEELIPPDVCRCWLIKRKGCQIKLTITDQILIPISDGSWDLNIYGDLCQVKALVSKSKVNGHPIYTKKFAGPTRTKNEMKNEYKKDIKTIMSSIDSTPEFV